MVEMRLKLTKLAFNKQSQNAAITATSHAGLSFAIFGTQMGELAGSNNELERLTKSINCIIECY